MRQLLVTLLVAACVGGEAGSPWAGTIDTLANGAVRVTSPAQGVWRAADEWRLVPELTLGSVEGEGPQVFASIAAIAVADDGRIFVLDRQLNELRVFDAAGAHLHTAGRTGKGPGEFERANGLAWMPDGDSLLVVDAAGGRYNVFDRNGRFVRSMPRPLTSWGYIFEGGFIDGQVYDRGSRRRGETFEDVLIGSRLAASAQLTDTLAFPAAPGEPILPFRFESARGGMVMSVPFSPVPAWQIGRDGSIWWGFGGEYRILRLTPAGDTLREIVAVAPDVPVTDDEVATWAAGAGPASFREMGGSIDVDRIPKTKPHFTDLFVDPEGHLWVDVPTPDGTTAFDVFAADGRRLGRVRTGVRRDPWVKPIVRNGRLHLVVPDDLEVPHVHVLRIETTRA